MGTAPVKVLCFNLQFFLVQWVGLHLASCIFLLLQLTFGFFNSDCKSSCYFKCCPVQYWGVWSLPPTQLSTILNVTILWMHIKEPSLKTEKLHLVFNFLSLLSCFAIIAYFLGHIYGIFTCNLLEMKFPFSICGVIFICCVYRIFPYTR